MYTERADIPATDTTMRAQLGQAPIIACIHYSYLKAFCQYFFTNIFLLFRAISLFQNRLHNNIKQVRCFFHTAPLKILFTL